MPAAPAAPAAGSRAAGSRAAGVALTFPLPAEAAAALDAAVSGSGPAVSLEFVHPRTGTTFALDTSPEALHDLAEADPLPTREEVEERMGQTFSEALREAIAEHEANPGAAVPWAEARARIIAAVPALREAYGAEGTGG